MAIIVFVGKRADDRRRDQRPGEDGLRVRAGIAYGEGGGREGGSAILIDRRRRGAKRSGEREGEREREREIHRQEEREMEGGREVEAKQKGQKGRSCPPTPPPP